MENKALPLPMEELETAIGYTFSHPELLQKALTHSSYSNEMGVKNHHLLCNERLEFLGDSVLSILTSEYLYSHYPDLPEGDLTRMRAEVVCKGALPKYAREFGLGNYMWLGHGEEKNGGRDRESTLENAFEALLAAMYLDAGENGKEVVRRFLMPFIIRELESGTPNDYKTQLQQFVQQTEGDFLEYVTVDEAGPDHKKIFRVEARLNSNVVGRGEGYSKREAEQKAAHAALELFGIRAD